MMIMVTRSVTWIEHREHEDRKDAQGIEGVLLAICVWFDERYAVLIPRSERVSRNLSPWVEKGIRCLAIRTSY